MQSKGGNLSGPKAVVRSERLAGRPPSTSAEAGMTREGDNSVGATAMSERRRGLRSGTQPRFGRWIDRADLDRLLEVMTWM